MKRPTQTVAETELGYRRGVVLGLTMAETMLLLLFCMLLAAGAILSKKNTEIEKFKTMANVSGHRIDPSTPPDLAERLSSLGLQPEEYQPLSELLDQREFRLTQGSVSDFWRELHVAREVSSSSAVEEYELSSDELKKVLALKKLAAEKGTDLLSELSELEKELDSRAIGAKGPGEHDWPPIIRLSEADGYSFEIGSVQLSASFEIKLKTGIADRLVDYVRQYGVDVIEIIGHTDEQRVLTATSNFDELALPVIRGERSVADLVPADNAGLGLARAMAVVKVLREDKRLDELTILPLSGGQLVMVGDLISDGSRAGDVAERRRIEIRLRRHDQIYN